MPPEPTLKRSTFLKAAAGAGALLAAPGVAAASTSSPSAAAPGATGAAPRAVQALVTSKVADLTGPGLTDRFRMQATDLGIPTRTPDGRLLFMFG
ncbi:MAG TPA: hypothetical protein VGD15_18385, partial [Kribbella sp.]